MRFLSGLVDTNVTTRAQKIEVAASCQNNGLGQCDYRKKNFKLLEITVQMPIAKWNVPSYQLRRMISNLLVASQERLKYVYFNNKKNSNLHCKITMFSWKYNFLNR